MKVLVVLSALAAIATAAALTKSELLKLENFNFRELLDSNEQTKIYFNCMLKKEECGVYKEVADLSFRVMTSECAECSPTQLEIFDNVSKEMQEKYTIYYNEVMEKIAAEKE